MATDMSSFMKYKEVERERGEKVKSEAKYEFLKTTPNNFQLESGRTEVELEENTMSGSQSL